MPLDVQPLSPTRRAIMLVVLIALLGASMAFAQLLVARTHGSPKIAWNFPTTFQQLPPDDEDPEDLVIRALGPVGEKERLLRGLIFEAPARLTPTQQIALLGGLHQTLAPEIPSQTVRPAPLAGRAGLELDAISHTGEFALLRMAVIDNRAIAICYSGAEALTDLDRLYFNNLCQRVKLQSEPHSKRK